MITRQTFAEKLRDFRLNTLAKMVPSSENPPIHFCQCGKPARHERGRHSGKMFVVPVTGCHHVYPVGEQPFEIEPMSYEELLAIRAEIAAQKRLCDAALPARKLSVVERLERMEAAA